MQAPSGLGHFLKTFSDSEIETTRVASSGERKGGRIERVVMAESEGEISFTSLQEELEYWKEKALEYRQRYVCCTPYNSLCEKCVCVVYVVDIIRRVTIVVVALPYRSKCILCVCVCVCVCVCCYTA